MEIPELNGPFKLTNSNVSIHLRKGVLGAFVLGPLRADGHLTVRLTGRSDVDMAGDLRRHIDKYDAFGFARAMSAAEALEMECLLYHHFEPVDNAAHPDRPAESDGTCPVCKAFG